jgi:hypothetical protein
MGCDLSCWLAMNRNLKEGQRRPSNGNGNGNGNGHDNESNGDMHGNIPGGHHIIQMDHHGNGNGNGNGNTNGVSQNGVAHQQQLREDSRSRSDGDYSDGEGDPNDMGDSKSQSRDYSPRENRLISFADEHAKPLCEHFFYDDNPDPEPEPDPGPNPRPVQPVGGHTSGNIPVKSRCLLTRGRAAKLAVLIVVLIVLAVLLFVFLR